MVTKSVPVAITIMMGCLLGLAAVGLAATVPSNEQTEGVEIKMGADWKQTFTPDARKFTVVTFLPEGQDVNNWKEMLTIRNLGSKGKTTPEQMLDASKSVREMECPGATEWTVIAKNESSILYEWQNQACRDRPARHGIERLLFGGRDLFVLHYAAKSQGMAPDTRARWIKTFSDATLDSGPDALAPQAGTFEVNELVPFPAENISTALKTAMESNNCNIKEATAERIECKRPRDYHSTNAQRSSGGEAVTATLEAQGAETLVHISTGKGFYGRLVKQDWSSRIYEAMVRDLQKPKQ
jgi:hypothetical protein